MPEFETMLRAAGQQNRRVRVRFSYPGEVQTEYERELEPYAIADGQLIAYSYFRDAYRTVELDRITDVEVRPETFTPRRPVDL